VLGRSGFVYNIELKQSREKELARPTLPELLGNNDVIVSSAEEACFLVRPLFLERAATNSDFVILFFAI